MVAVDAAEQVCELLRQGAVERGEADALVAEYGAMLLRHGPVRFFADLGEQALVDFLAERYAFAAQRNGTPFALRLSEGPLAADEAASPYTVIEVVIADRPFLIDSIQNFLIYSGTVIRALLHPILSVERDAQGRLTAFGEFEPEGTNEAHMFFVVDAVHSKRRQPLLEELRRILYDVIRCVDDYEEVTAQLEGLKEQAKHTKGGRAVARLVQWFQGHNFIFMGSLPYRAVGGTLVPQQERGQGLFHPDLHSEPHHEALMAQSARFLEHAMDDAPFCVVEETTVAARMHHRARLSLLLASAQPTAPEREALVVTGIFTNRSLRVDALSIPVVEGKIHTVMQHQDIAPGSYKYKEALDFFNGLPRFELFRLSDATLERLLEFFLAIVDQPRTEVALLEDAEQSTLRILVSVPGQEFLQEQVQQVRERVEGLYNLTAQNLFTVTVSAFTVLGLVFYRGARRGERLPDPAQVQEAIRDELLSRDDRLVRLWLNARGSGLEERLARTLVEGLPAEYKIAHQEVEIMADLSRLEQLAKTDTSQFSLRRVQREHCVKIVLYGWEQLSLSRLMPIFSNLRVLVVEEETFEVRLPERPAYMHTFLLFPPEGIAIVPETHQEPLQQLIFQILTHGAENDPLSALLLSADFDWRQLSLLQLYRNYLMQVGTVYTKSTINETLIRRPRATRALFRSFEVRFHPDLEGREAQRRDVENELREAEREIDNLTEDRIFKGLANLVQSTIRTNFYQDADSAVVAVKLASGTIEQLPSPRPLYEIYVYAPLMEGIHLRGDMIARGGIRYSDRPDDFRTEVLGLMATQMKKNALIVPLGSKGGFVVKDLTPYDGNARAAGDAQYRVFINALLSVTDNLVQSRPVAPPQLIRHDDDDPYLVVAADKGTAHLSDAANEVSMERGFWLGDAFASGGSNGYDHKVVGITARGAWESVKRLFWELGVDIQREPVTVVGIGDMSGDVFGNGMLASRTLKLVGAFDHRHIFIDPDPDPEPSYQERERLFRLPRSAWSDYNAELISEGGGIFPRNTKAIPLTPQMRQMLGSDADTLSGEEMIQALLRAPVDLLWNGGIGTYIKSAHEIHADVGDPNNDAVRVNADEVRIRVIGEGGNLGFTQSARIDLDVGGTALHTDAIDNAGGVNMSDHEVNLKILLGALLDDGQLEDRGARNTLLHELEPSVTQAVLRANFRQVVSIGMDRLRSAENVEPFIRLVDLLATQGGLDRRTEAIPNAQRFQNFQNDGHGVPRPVLSVLLAYTKMLLYRRLVDAPLTDDPYLARYYLAYFPTLLRERFDLDTAHHPLRRQIIATVVTNQVIDQAGMTFVAEMAGFSGRSWPEVVQAYLLADAVIDGAGFREQVYAQATTLPADHQYELLMGMEALLQDIVRWLLLNPDPQYRSFDNEAALRDEFHTYCDELPGLLSVEDKEAMAGGMDELTRFGLRGPAARVGAMVPYLRGYPLVCGIACEGEISVRDAFALASVVDGRFRFRQLETALLALRFADPMQKRFGDGLLRSLELERRGKLFAVLALRAEGKPPEAWLDAYLEEREPAWKAYEATVRQVFSSEHPDVVPLAVAIGQLQSV